MLNGTNLNGTNIVSYAPEKPRERLVSVGAQLLRDEELVALLLSCGAEGKTVTELSLEVLRYAGGLPGLPRVGIGALAQMRGMGLAKASRLLGAIELGRRVLSRPLDRSLAISSSEMINAAFRPRLQNETREHFIVVATDAKMRPTAEFTVAIGGLVSCSLTIADVFRSLIREAAAGAVFIHNHPSGVPSPSIEDMAFTERLEEAGDLLGILVFDHVIVGRDGYFSFRDAGFLGK